MATPEQNAAILASEPWIGELIERLKSGPVYWRDSESRLLRVLRIKLDWIEFPHDPNPVSEPAALLDGGAVVALWNTSPENFVVSSPALRQAAQSRDVQSGEGETVTIPNGDAIAGKETPVTLADLREQARTLNYRHADDHECLASYGRDDDQAVILRVLMERAIIRKAVTDILAVQGENPPHQVGPAYTIDVYDGEAFAEKHCRDLDKIMAAIMSTDGDELIVRRYQADDNRGKAFIGSISLIYGNDGYDVISDHHCSLDTLLAGATALAERLEEELHDELPRPRFVRER